MNEFTKDELEALWGYCHEYCGQHDDLTIKIQSKIDNYCISNGHIYEFSLGRGKCENCGELE